MRSARTRLPETVESASGGHGLASQALGLLLEREVEAGGVADGAQEASRVVEEARSCSTRISPASRSARPPKGS